ncbi:putative metalloprotease CJM1_0395 family protein [Zhongshania sp.]|uniref:putative metalloprotease CJM1_0395 family protein n=1 Tax=Zhongshania sp. TaxID=1971902 RepID=UPI00356197E4
MDAISTSSVSPITRSQSSGVGRVELRSQPVGQGSQALAPVKSPQPRPINAPAQDDSKSRSLVKSDPNLSIFAESGVSPARLAILSAPRLYVAEAQQSDDGVVYSVTGAANGDAASRNGEAESEAVAAAPEAAKRVDAAVQKAEEQQIRAEVQELSARDREVHRHELAHSVAGGRYTGSPSYEFKRGPDGNTYAVNGEVSIDIAPAATPQATIDKMQIVKQAALAPSEPSSQDRQVAAQAARIEAEARRELASSSAEDESAASQGQALASATDRNLASDRASADIAAVDIKAQRLSSLYSTHGSSIEREPLSLLDSRA